MSGARGGRFERAAASALGLLLLFAALARGAHDLWAAAAVHLAVLALALAVLLRRCWPADAPGLRVALLLPAACAGAAATASFAGAVNPGESWMAWTAALSALLALLCAGETMSSEDAPDALLRTVAPLFLIELALLLGQRLRADSFILDEAPGTMVNPNVLAAFILPWLPPLAERAVRAWKERGARSYWTLIAAAAVLDLLLTSSTWAMVALALALPFATGPRRARELLSSRKARAACAGLAVLVAGLLVWKFAFRQGWAGDPAAPIERLRWWASAWRMFVDHPWTGVGLGNFSSAYLAYRSPGAQNTLFAHSAPFGLLAEAGLAGGIGVVLLLGAWARALRRAPDALERRWPWALGAGLLMFFSLADLSVEYFAVLLLLTVFLGTAASAVPSARLRPRRSVLAVLAAAALAAVPALLSPLLASRIAVAADARLAEGDLEGALRGFASAAAADPRASESRRGWARALHARFLASRERRDIEEAVLRQREAVERDRLCGRCWAEFGAYLAAAGRREEALAAFQRAVALNAPGAAPREAVERLLKAR